MLGVSWVLGFDWRLLATGRRACTALCAGLNCTAHPTLTFHVPDHHHLPLPPNFTSPHLLLFLSCTTSPVTETHPPSLKLACGRVRTPTETTTRVAAASPLPSSTALCAASPPSPPPLSLPRLRPSRVILTTRDIRVRGARLRNTSIRTRRTNLLSHIPVHARPASCRPPQSHSCFYVRTISTDRHRPQHFACFEWQLEESCVSAAEIRRIRRRRRAGRLRSS